MKNIIQLGFLAFFLLIASARLSAQVSTDTTSNVQDSIINSLNSQLQDLSSQLQDMNMQNIMLQEELQRTGHKIMMDSISLANRMHLIDSLRALTPGAPLVVDGDTLLRLYARRGGITPESRVETASEKITYLGHRLTLRADSLYVFEGDYTSDIMAANEVILSITDIDGLWAGKPRAKLAADYTQIIQAKVNEIHEEYGLHRKLQGLLFAIIIIIAQIFLLILTNRLFRRWKQHVMRYMVRRLKPIVLKDYEFLNVHRQGIIVMTLYKIMRYFIILLQLFISIPLLFSIFPETETLTFTILGYIWDPFKDILLSIVNYVPKLCQIIVIWFCFHYLLRLIRYFADEIEQEHLKINGFYPDWAKPSYYILRVLLISLMVVMIWPLLPSSDSQVFQGVSVFIGIVVSLGSTAIIGNLMAGLVMTYMRPFHIGDYIKVGDTVGEVIEKTVFVTRIRTRKNEVVTIQNSSLMGSQTSNFTVAARNFGIIVHTKVTIGYDVPWQKIKEIMESAALATPGVKHKPHPFMMITALDDFYVEYEINAYTDDAVKLPAVYSALHANLLKRFFEESVEIMSPHIFARRDGIDTQMPEEFKS
ncbi:MAG: mechanosensitive ion channel [Bacteroidaceae bacterium]|nr:mechanosensitive ion channel [Bacteroidaceae bacterium]